eukprot:8248445-Alexandrium_andersonii.AAC.1
MGNPRIASTSCGSKNHAAMLVTTSGASDTRCAAYTSTTRQAVCDARFLLDASARRKCTAVCA